MLSAINRQTLRRNQTEWQNLHNRESHRRPCAYSKTTTQTKIKTMKIWPNLLQGSDQWHAARTGKLTASNASKIITAGGKLSTQRAAYLDELISDCFCPGQNAWQGNANTDRGTAMEPLARAAFERRLSLTVEEVGFVTREDGVIGCSPDGLISRGNGKWLAGLEIKCPLPKTHFRYLIDNKLPDTYKPQVHFSMMVTGLPWHFFSYCPGMKPLHIFVKPDDYTAKLQSTVEDFVSEYSKLWATARQFREDPDHLPTSSSDEI